MTDIEAVIEKLEEDIAFTLRRPVSPSDYRMGKVDGIRLALSYLKEVRDEH